jgi:hypothetical protein
VSVGILDSYDLKGGVALELRLADEVRATKEIDIGVPVERTKQSGIHILKLCLGKDLGKAVEKTISSLFSWTVVPWGATNALQVLMTERSHRVDGSVLVFAKALLQVKVG